jgi:hypothetical protein
VKKAVVKNLDETGFRVGGKTQGLHVASTGNATYYHVSPKRNSLIEGLSGTYEACDNIVLPIEREKKIKGWSRQKKNDLVNALNPSTCVKKTAFVFGVIDFKIRSVAIPNVLRLMSTKIGVCPAFKTEATSDTQVKAGTITSDGPNISFNASKVKSFADAPEFNITEYLTPSHLLHTPSNSLTLGPFVNLGSSCFNNSITESRSSLNRLLFINGHLILVCIFWFQVTK